MYTFAENVNQKVRNNMTREEAIVDIRDNIKPVVGGKSLDMAIKALEQEPILDKIRAEIEQEYNRLRGTRADETLELGICLGLKMSLKIINKYKAESEPQERNDKE